MLGRRIAARPRPPATVRDLESALLEEWNSIPQILIDNLIASMANSLTLSGANLAASSKTHLGFVEESIKINQKVYHRDILQAVVLPWAQTHLGNANWAFQLHSAPGDKVKKTQDWSKNFPNTIYEK
ncbi:DDE_3 domain-containing protein [Trichonephila clavipes]|uniref:DDE_3 domain-containing protein n=1 Tax=Trichonephila clavipes TaxID=2585209 RepID=A0A8X6WD60_TRICX|nr:DDE_3 domain-containing protein [Trichonephila clavipes]